MNPRELRKSKGQCCLCCKPNDRLPLNECSACAERRKEGYRTKVARELEIWSEPYYGNVLQLALGQLVRGGKIQPKGAQ